MFAKEVPNLENTGVTYFFLSPFFPSLGHVPGPHDTQTRLHPGIRRPGLSQPHNAEEHVSFPHPLQPDLQPGARGQGELTPAGW